MTTPREEQPQTEAPATPRVATAPPRARWRFGNVPSRLGRARTSTVVLAVLFVAVFVLWVYVRPDPVATTTGTTSGVGGPAAPAATTSSVPTTTSSEAPTTTAGTTTSRPTETTTEPGSTSDETTTGETTPSTRSSTSTSSRSTTSGSAPTTTVPAPTS